MTKQESAELVDALEDFIKALILAGENPGYIREWDVTDARNLLIEELSNEKG